MRLDSESLQVFVWHRELYGPVRAGGGFYNMNLECLCGWKQTVALVDGTPAEQERVKAIVSGHNQQPELELGDEVMDIFERTWRVLAVNSRGEFEDMIPEPPLDTRDAAACFLVWCDRLLARDLPQHTWWLQRYVRVANAALELLAT